MKNFWSGTYMEGIAELKEFSRTVKNAVRALQNRKNFPER